MIAGGMPVYFSSGSTAGQGAPETMKGQALVTLKKLEENITAAGLSLGDLAFVRAYLAPGADGKIDYAGWNEAWTEMFAKAPHKPARTTVGVPLLGRPGTLIEIEFVCTTPGKPDLFSSSDKLGLPVTNPMLKPYGTKEGRIYAGMGIKPGAAYYWTAGTTSPLLKPNEPPTSLERYGDMKTQATGLLQRLQENLANVGLTFSDVIYLRAFVGPDTLRGGKFDYDGWNAAYSEFFNHPKNPHKPARTTVTTPTYGNPGMMLEVELLCAFPGAPARVSFDNAASPGIKAYGAPTAAISSGVASKAGNRFYFSAGAVPTVGGNMKTQALSALEVLKGRLAEAGMTFKDVTFLRAYVVPEADGSIDRAGWGEAYTTFFNNKEQPHKPARTTIAVHSLPRAEWKIEIDVIAAAP
jgi:enamine deaminase RidA (YjgF/YER057c/UK114 family)